MPTTLTKSLAIDALVQALAVNSSPAAEKTLEQMVTGEIPFGGHAKQAAQKAMLNLVLRSATQPSPENDAFLARIFSDPDESIRPGDQGVYPAAELRNDTALVIAKIGSPGVRLALAKIYTQPSTPPGTREAIENVIRTRVPANFAAQVEVFRGAETPEQLKSALQKSLIKQNEAAVKAALKLQTEGKATPAAAGGNPFSPVAGSTKSKTAPPSSGGGLFDAVGKLFGGGSSAPAAAGSPFGAMAAMSPAEMKEIFTKVQKRMEAAAAKERKPGAAPGAPWISPDVMTVEIFGEIQNRQPTDLGLVAKSLWNAEFADSVAKDLADSKGDAAPIINALASLPTKTAREKLKEILHKQRTKGPEELAKMETAAPAETPAAGVAGNRRGGKNKKDARRAHNAWSARRNAVWNGGPESARRQETRGGRVRNRLVRPGFAGGAEVGRPLQRTSAGKTDASYDASATTTSHVGGDGKADAGEGRETKGARRHVRLARCHREVHPPMGRAAGCRCRRAAQRRR